MTRPGSVVLADLQAARDELHDAQRILHMLLIEDDAPDDFPRSGIAIARQIVERDLATRRVEAWTSVIDRLRTEARALGLFE